METDPVTITVDGVFKLREGTVITPHLDAERLPGNSKLAISVRHGDGTTGDVSGRLELRHFDFVDGTHGFRGAVILDPASAGAVAVGDVLHIRVSETRS